MSEQPDAPARDGGGAAQPGAGTPGTPGGPPVSERMQALLSRAVEDQLSEQRQLASLVAEVRALMSALPGEVSAAAPVDQAVRSEVAQLRAALGSVEQRLAVLTAAAERPADHAPVNAVGARVEGLGSAVAEVKAAQAGLQAKLGELSSAVAALARSQAESEQRLIAHVDEAVLALAEVLVRRGKPSARPAAPVAAAPVAAPVAAAPVVPAPIVAAPEVVLAPVVDDETAEVERHLAEDAPDDDSDDAAHSTGDASELLPPVTAADDDDEDEDEDDDDDADADDDADDDADEDDADEDDADEDDADEDDADEDDDSPVAPELPAAPPVEASTWGRGLGQTAPVIAADDDPPPAPAADPWVVPSPFQPGPRRERGDSGAAAALAELQDDDADEPDSPDSEDRPRRRPWWRPGD